MPCIQMTDLFNVMYFPLCSFCKINQSFGRSVCLVLVLQTVAYYKTGIFAFCFKSSLVYRVPQWVIFAKRCPNFIKTSISVLLTVWEQISEKTWQWWRGEIENHKLMFGLIFKSIRAKLFHWACLELWLENWQNICCSLVLRTLLVLHNPVFDVIVKAKLSTQILFLGVCSLLVIGVRCGWL